MDLLDRLGQWTDVGALSAALDLPPETVIVLLDGLAAHGLVEMAAAGLDPGPLAQIEPVRKAVAGIGPWDRWSPRQTTRGAAGSVTSIADTSPVPIDVA